MANEISLAQFNRIASGDYNAGQIDIKDGPNGAAELVKVNNHVWKTSKNNVEFTSERVLKVKFAFIDALAKAGVKEDSLEQVRNQLGLPTKMNATGDVAKMKTLMERRLAPLSRTEVREIIDKYAKGGKGYTQASRAAYGYQDAEAAYRAANQSARTIARRNAANPGGASAHGPEVQHVIGDAVLMISARVSLSELDGARSSRFKGENAVNESKAQTTVMRNSFSTLLIEAAKLLPASVRESAEFRICGAKAKLVKDENGKLSALIREGDTSVTVNLGDDAESYILHLIGRTAVDAETLGGTVVKGLLSEIYDHDLEGLMTNGDRTSLTRQFAALLVAKQSGDALNMEGIVKGPYNTGVLVEIAENAVDGKFTGNTKEALDAYHQQLLSDNADLPEEMKQMLEQVANVPLEKPDGEGEFIVRAPIVGDINQVVNEINVPKGPAPKLPKDVGGAEGIKNFVADLVFSDDTMVSDVVINKPGEKMRGILSGGNKLACLAEIIKNPDILDTAVAPEIVGIVKEGFAAIAKAMDASFKAATGETLAEAAQKDGFADKFAAFFRDSKQLPGDKIAQFDNILQSMANKGCEKMQAFINKVFNVNVGNANDLGALTTDPYKEKTAEQIKAELDGKSLNQIIDSASNSDAPGQVGFFRQVVSTYYTQLGKADKRSAFAAAMRYAQTFNFAGKEGEELASAKKVAINKFTGAILKGSSPLLQKMMQGLPKDVMGEYADALDDMKSNLAPIPRKIVQAHLMNMINESRGKENEIVSIKLNKSLGAASVGEAFLCTFEYKTGKKDKNGGDVIGRCELVVKIMRHDAERRVKSEAEIFTAAAEKIPGMAKTWEGQLKQYMTEFDFTTEAANVEQGMELYDIKGNDEHPMRGIAPEVKSMKLSTLVPAKKDVMVAELASGSTVDRFFKRNTQEIRTAVSEIFEQDSATGRLKWHEVVDPKTGKTKQVPVFKKNIPAAAMSNAIHYAESNYVMIQQTQARLIQATKLWFHQALFGSGKFHGDTHAGNLMASGSEITFIDFGNLFTLSKRPDGVDERHELLRIIMGAAFRDKDFVLQGFEKLLSPEGKAALKANRAKAEAILTSVLSKGKFSYDIVYRLHSAVSELQKLGLELPPQVNCFVQSMTRLSNSITEMNTILNQTKAILDTCYEYKHQGPAPKRDELDLIGKAFDYFASEEGKELVPDEDGLSDYDGIEITKYNKFLFSDELLGYNAATSPAIRKGGAYHTKIVNRIKASSDPAGEADNIVAIVESQADELHNETSKSLLDRTREDLAKFKQEIAAAKDDAARDKAIDDYATAYGRMMAQLISLMQNNETSMRGTIVENKLKPPSSFASAVMNELMDNFEELSNTFADSQAKLAIDVKLITRNEMDLGWFAGYEKMVNAIKNDAKNMAGENSYKIDIGV